MPLLLTTQLNTAIIYPMINNKLIEMQTYLNEAITAKLPFTYCSNVDGKLQAIMVFNPTLRVNYD